MNIDYSTLNIAKITSRLSVYKKPASYHISDSMGSGCFLDAPGFPSYFVRDVYTQYGNCPSRGVQQVITLPDGVSYAVAWADGRKVKKLSLWKPLPLDHVRVQMWIDYCISYFANCWRDPQKGLSPNANTFRIGAFKDDELPLMAQLAGVDTNSPNLRFDLEAITHAATAFIRTYYPEYQYRPGYAPVSRHPDWWEVFAEAPTASNCPGKSFQWGKAEKHPTRPGTYCQVCGTTN